MPGDVIPNSELNSPTSIDRIKKILLDMPTGQSEPENSIEVCSSKVTIFLWQFECEYAP